MLVTYKTLGQSNPAATTATTLYTVPAATQAVCSTLVVCNQGLAATFRVAVRVAGLALTEKQYLYYDVALPAGATLCTTIGITLGAADVVTVYASTATVSFSLFGQEIS